MTHEGVLLLAADQTPLAECDLLIPVTSLIPIVIDALTNFTPACGFHRVTTYLENLEMSGILLRVREMSRKKSCQGKVA